MALPFTIVFEFSTLSFICQCLILAFIEQQFYLRFRSIGLLTLFSEAFPVSNVLRAMLVFPFPHIFPIFSPYFLLFLVISCDSFLCSLFCCSVFSSVARCWVGLGDCDGLGIPGPSAVPLPKKFTKILPVPSTNLLFSISLHMLHILKIPDVYSFIFFCILSGSPKHAGSIWKHLEAAIWVCFKVAVPVEHLPFYYQKYYKKVPAVPAVPFLRESHELHSARWPLFETYWNRLKWFQEADVGNPRRFMKISAFQHFSTIEIPEERVSLCKRLKLTPLAFSFMLPTL